MKAFTFVAVASLAFASLLAACGGGHEPSVDVTVESEPTPAPEGAQAPQTATNAHGESVMVWQQAGRERREVWSRRFDGRRWSHAQRLDADDPAIRDTISPQVALDDGGRALALWSESHRGRLRLVVAEVATGQRWRAPVVLDAPDLAHALEARLGLDERGRAIAVWTRMEDGRRSVWTSRQPGPRLPWDAPSCLHRSPPDVSSSPQPRLAVAPDGQAIAAWLQADGPIAHDHTGVWAARFTPAQRWSAAQRLDMRPAPVHAAPWVAFDERGAGVVRWTESDRLEGGADRRWQATLDKAAGWQPTKAVP